jgi:hypothetical protein
MEIDEEKLQAAIQKAVSEQLYKEQMEAQAAAEDAKLPKELTLENVLRYDGQLQETPYTRDTVRNIIAETIAYIEQWNVGESRLNEDVLSHFFAWIDRETKSPTTMEQYQERRDAEEAELERQHQGETAIIF